MKEPDWTACTEEELWKYVAHNLSTNGINTILVGGAVAAICYEGAYRSGDLDFVVESLFEDKNTENHASHWFRQGFEPPLSTSQVPSPIYRILLSTRGHRRRHNHQAKRGKARRSGVKNIQPDRLHPRPIASETA